MSAANVYLDQRTSAASKAPGIPARGPIIAAVAVGLGLFLVRPLPGGGIAWGDVGILAALAATALVGARESRRLLAEREAVASPAGRWMTIKIESGGPTDTAGIAETPKAPPRNDPERRSLQRRARERHREGAASRR